jgi:NADH-quinone oxidoreductase subunit N
MGLAWLVGLAAVLSAVSLYYYLSVLKQAFVKSAELGVGSTPLPISHLLCITLPAAALVVLGLFPAQLAGPLARAVASLLP